MANYNTPPVVNIADTATAAKMFDKLTRIDDGRRIQPLDILDNVFYPHRYLYDGYNLQIGDTYFMIPPEFIMVNSEATSQKVITLRQENTQKLKSGYHKRIILIDLVFNGIEQLNGYPVNGPEGIYYVDGLRQLLAQFKCTPFLPITNELINGMYGIFTVALQSIVISTVPGFPNTMTAQLTLQEVNMTAYLEMPDLAFKYMIDWDLFRFYYQRFLTEEHMYKKLQSLSPINKRDRFRLSILNNQVFESEDTTQSTLLDVVTDTKIVCVDEFGQPADTNYITWLDSEENDVAITGFQCGYSNILTNIQLSKAPSPTVQFMGGMDTIYNITFETKDYSVVQAIEQCQITNDVMTRNNIKMRSVGFVKLESELVAFTGSLFVIIESVTTNTVPDFPGLYSVQMQCVAYDIGQSSRETLNGFKPFDCSHTECTSGKFEQTHEHFEQAITQDWDGLKVKIKQDNYAEWKLRTELEVYPDLYLPTYDEVNKFVEKCRRFRAANGLTQLPYKIYPTNPVGILHGNSPSYNGLQGMTDDIIYPSDLKELPKRYDVYVDPDFYVFYPYSYDSFAQEGAYEYEPIQRSSMTKIKKQEVFIDTPSGTSYPSSNVIESFVQCALSYVGCAYFYGAEGDDRFDSAGRPMFDCSGLVMYCMKQVGLYSKSPISDRLVVSTIPTCGLFMEVPFESRRRGDVICYREIATGNWKHVTIYLGEHNGKTNQVVHASNENPYPIGGVKISNNYTEQGRERYCFRIITNEQESDDTTALDSLDMDYIDAVGNIIFSQEGNYGSVNANDKGAVSIGKVQWRADRAKNLLKSIATAYPTLTKSTLGGALYNEVMGSRSWASRIVTSSEKEKISSLLTTQQGKEAQDALARNDIATYITVGQNYGLIDPAALAYFADGVNQYGTGSSVWKKIAQKAIANGGTLDAIYNATKQVVSQYMNRRTNVYNAIKSNPIFGDSSVDASPSGPTLTQDEFLSICRVVQAETQGEAEENNGIEKAVAQVIYDMLTDINKQYGGLGAILTSGKFASPTEDTVRESVDANVRAVFCNNDKYWPDYRALDLLDQDSETYATIANRNNQLDPLGMICRHVFWGIKKKGSDVKYTVLASTDGTGDASLSSYEVESSVNYDTITLDASNLKYFGEPILVKTSKSRRQIGSDGVGNDVRQAFNRDEVNSGVNIFNTSFCDMHQYSARGRLVRAFPTYLFCILDDQAQWYDGKKLWSNYYTHRAVVDIAVHGTNDMPTETATITITNSYHNLSQTQGGLSNYNLKNDTHYDAVRRKIYEWTGLMIGTGPVLTETLIHLHQVIYKRAKLREDVRVHLRMGYGSDPLSLAPMINGRVSDITLGDQISMVVTSDGHEFISHITSVNEKGAKDTNNGWLGLFGLGEPQESSNIIADIMCQRQSWCTYLMRGVFEGSKYSIEHYGLFLRDPGINGFGGELFETDGRRDQYDICKNIYLSNYKGEPYCSQYNLAMFDGESNVVFNKYNMTPWDVFQVCTQQVPEYILKSTYHQFDSRLYFGIPGWMEKYRYDIIGGVSKDGSVDDSSLYEEAKVAAQCWYLDPLTTIIDNQIRVTSRYSHTNIKVMYTEGSTVKPTAILHSDDTIDFAYQKTNILDTPIVQDALGPDALYSFISLYDIGKECAKRIGVSTLLYGWQQQYQGQIILMGCPGLKANDYLMVNDSFSEIYGVSIAREVIHSFNTMTGFTTSVTPGMIGFSTTEESGMIVQSQNTLMLLNTFSALILSRQELSKNYQHYLSIFANYEVMREKYISILHGSAISEKIPITDEQVEGFAQKLMIASHLAKVGFGVANIAHLLRQAKNAGGLIAATSKLASKICTAIKGIKSIKSAYTTFKAGVQAFSASVPGIGWTVFAIATVVDWVATQVFEWLSNRNVVCLLPMWWQNYPFVSGVKDGEKILLTPGNPDATAENTKGDAIDMIDHTDL